MSEKKRDWITVESSNLAAVAYEPGTADENGTLFIRFQTGNEYQYFGVSKKLFEDLKAAESVGKFFHSSIKSGGYAFARMN
jgi:tRNA(Glu) U13 pseudouridine synthase TruD